MAPSTQWKSRVGPLSETEAHVAACFRTGRAGAVGLERTVHDVAGPARPEHRHRTGNVRDSTDDEESTA